MLDMYQTCPKKYYHIKVLKDAKDEDSSFSDEGKKIHDAAYKRAVLGVPLPLPMRPYEKLIASFAELPGEKHGEMKLALNAKFEPRDFFAKDVWVRSILDFLVVVGDHAVIVDWKTGKPREGFDQLKLTAAILSRYMPEINKFTLAYAWLKNNTTSSMKMGREHMRAVWSDAYEQVKDIEEALKTTTFPANETPLCKWCPVRTCPHNKKDNQ